VSRSHPDPIRIERADDPRIASFTGLRERELRTSDGALRERLFLGEGRLVLERLLDSPHRLRSVFVVESRLAGIAELLARAPADAAVYVASAELHAGASGVRFHQGLLALGVQAPEPTLAELAARADRIVVLESVFNHDNLGSVFRNVAALCGDRGAVLLDPRCADPWYRKSVRTSMGWVLEVPSARAPRWPEELAELRAAGWRVLALTPHAEALDLSRIEVREGERIALLVGTESAGLSTEAIAAAGERVRIPIDARVDSLNLATAAAIALERLRR
jgi:tRNA G18 (ribose-2'-O)-methylase SpoU